MTPVWYDSQSWLFFCWIQKSCFLKFLKTPPIFCLAKASFWGNGLPPTSHPFQTRKVIQVRGVFEGSFNWDPFFWGDQSWCQSMVNLKDFPYNVAWSLGWCHTPAKFNSFAPENDPGPKISKGKEVVFQPIIFFRSLMLNIGGVFFKTRGLSFPGSSLVIHVQAVRESCATLCGTWCTDHRGDGGTHDAGKVPPVQRNGSQDEAHPKSPSKLLWRWIQRKKGWPKRKTLSKLNWGILI